MKSEETTNLIFEHQEEVRLLVDHIVETHSFGKSPTYSHLLKYLVETTIKGEVPKESTIGSHLFGNDVSQDTSKVRVYVFHLRKKLEIYYEDEGVEDKFRLTIPKGSYEVELHPNLSDKKKRWGSKRTLSNNAALLSLIAIFIGVSTFIFLTRNAEENNSNQPDFFWSDFLLDDKPTMVVLGDLLVFAETNLENGEFRSIRIPNVNSKLQFEEYKRSRINSQYGISELPYSFLIMSSAEWMENLTGIFHNKREFSIRVASQIDMKDIQDYNIVFVGLQKTAGLLNNYFETSQFSLLDQGRTGYALNKQDEYRTFVSQGQPEENHRDYAFIAKYRGANNNEIFMFAGIWDSGTSQALKEFTEKERLTQITNYMIREHSKVPSHFEMLIEVSGVNRVGFNSNIVELNVLD